MNAYEIADELQKHGLNGDNHGLFNKRIQNMLRQQADRIAELEETIGACYAVQKMQAEEVYKGNDRIAELEKLLAHQIGADCREMRYIQDIENKDARIAELENKSKPVAWMEYIQDEEWEVWYTEPTDLPKGHSYKPLYLAPQTKPLSDEEIIEIFNQIWNDGGNTNGVMHRYARAIEERHGIK